MRIGFPTNNLRTLSNHTALSKYIGIIEIENGQVIERIAIKNPLPRLASGVSSEKEGRGLGAGKIIPQILLDYNVDVFVASEIGEGMQRNLEYAGIKVVLSKDKELKKIIEKLEVEK